MHTSLSENPPPLSQQPHNPYLKGSKELVFWFLNLGRWPFMEEAGCQEVNEDEQKNSFLFQSFIASPQGGSFLPSHYWHHLKSLAIFFFDLWRVCWFSSESIGGSRVVEFLPHFCFIPAKSPQGVKKKKNLRWLMKSRAPWYILNLAVSSGFFSLFYLMLYISLYHFRQFKRLKDFWRSLFLLHFEWD